MVIGFKDAFKLVGVSVIFFCAAFVCTFFLSYYMDVITLRDEVPAELSVLYNAQVSMAQFTSAITGGVLVLIAAVMLVFYVKLYVDSHAKQLGVLKALGFSNARLAASFCLFGLSAFVGCALGFGFGYVAAPLVYKGMSIDGLPEIAVTFHYELLLGIVFAPTVLFSLIAFCFALIKLKCPVMDLIKGKESKAKAGKREDKERGFLKEVCFKTLSSKKLLTFFFAFSAFCFSAMVQMGLSMEDLTSETMGIMILVIGLVLAAVTAFMSVTALINANVKTASLMKAFGYTAAERFFSVLGGFIPFAFVGFGVGAAYQYGLLQLMINVVFADVEGVPTYEFNVPVFFITLGTFVAAYAALFAVYFVKFGKISVKEVMLEN